MGSKREGKRWRTLASVPLRLAQNFSMVEVRRVGRQVN
jgi:hypothetical protein